MIMITEEQKLLPEIQQIVDSFDFERISAERKAVLQVLIDYISSKMEKKSPVNLNFICTHNSRRSQFSQIWAQTAANYFQVPASCFSGGVEVTAFNERAVASIERFGFKVTSEGVENPKYTITNGINDKPIIAFSKVYDDATSPKDEFAAVMTCSHADENCPYIPGTEARIPVRYEDPKAFDDSPEEAEKYDERSRQIGEELFYVFKSVEK